MPGNEVGDRVHNFFDQGTLSQDQRHTQLDGNWSTFNNNLWGGNQRQIGGPITSGPNNYSAQQSDSDREKGNQFSLAPYGLNFSQSSLRPEFDSSHPQQLNLNGFMHTSQVIHTRQNEANFLGLGAEPDRHSLISRGQSIIESQQRSGSPHTHSTSIGSPESRMNFNFFAGQQQMSGQQPGMLQALPRQQFAINDGQLLPQQVMLKQMQELQRQKQLQQLDAMQRNVASQMPTFPNQMVGQHSLAINGNPMYDASNFPWASQVMAGNTNWSQRGLPSSMRGYSNGLMITPEQGQTMRFMGLTQQASESLYGVPVSSSRNVNTLSVNTLDKPGIPQVSASGNTFSSNTQYAPPPEQVSVQGGTTVARIGSEGKNSFDHGSSQGLVNVVSLGSFNQMQQQNMSIPESGCTRASESLLEKSATLNTTKQAAVTLDPTEEKILFGNDESIWEAFGGTSVMGAGGLSRLDGSDLPNGSFLLQSGTWSALMQSAVAETSSSDVGMQEEWSGLRYQDTRAQSGNQQSSVCQDNVKGHPVWVDRSQKVSFDTRNATNDVNSNYVDSSALQQPYPNQSRQRLPTESQISQDGRMWLDSSQPTPQTEKNWALEHVDPSRDFRKTDIGFWSNKQSTCLHDNNDQSSGRPSALNFIESVQANESMTSASQDDLHDKAQNSHMPMDTSGSAVMRPESISNYDNMGNRRVGSADDAVASMGNIINHESNQKFHGNCHLDFYKSVNLSVQYGTEGSVKEHRNLNEGPSILESSVTMPDDGAAEMHETENGDAGENSNDSHRSSFQHQAQAGGLRENVWSGVGDQRSLPGGKESPSEQAGKPAPVTRKFQYHPLGDLDMDVDSHSYASKQILHVQPLPQHSSSGVRGHETQARFLGQSSSDSKDLEGRVFFHGASKILDGVSSGGIHNGQCPNTSAPFVKSDETLLQHQNFPPSQNMLELLHKVDQSKEQNPVSLLSCTDGNGLSETASGEPVRLNQSQSSNSHGFNLQLAPPSQVIGPPNVNITSQSSSRPVDALSSGFTGFEKGDKGHALLASVSSAQYIPSSHPPPQIGSRNDKSGTSGSMDADGLLRNLKGNLSAHLASGSSYLRNPQHHHTVAAGGKMVADQSSLPFGMHAYLDHRISDSQDQAIARQSVSNSLNSLATGRGLNHFGLRANMHQMPMSLPGVMPAVSRNDNLSPSGANMWSQPQVLAARAHNAAELLKSQFQSNNASGPNSFTKQQAYEQDRLRRVDAVSSQGIVGGEEPMVAEALPTGKIPGVPQEEEPIVTNSVASQKDSEAFHSLKPNNTAQQDYSLLHQTQAMKSMVADPTHLESERLKGTDNSSDSQEISGNTEQTWSGVRNNMVRDASVSQTSIGGANMLNFSPQPGNRIPSFLLAHGASTSREILPVGPSDPQKFATGTVAARVEHSGISPQMAPSWFQQYGAFKNGQSLLVHNVPELPTAKNADQQFISGKFPSSFDGCNSMELANVAADPGRIADDGQTANIFAPSERVLSLDALIPHASNPTLASIRPKKRKTVTSGLLSWNKEIGQGFMRLQNMSLAEVHWAKSSNRLVEKIEDETDPNEDMLRISRPKRRLILTTQLMQQVFRSPSPAVLSLVASSNQEIIVYSLARLIVGDACSLVSCSESDSSVHLGNGNLVSSNVKNSETIRHQYFPKVVEDFTSRAKELEDELLRLDERASILDFRLDLQDLERFGVINRFARFHGRSQVDGAESSSSSSDPAAVIQRPFPQRYVSAHPMPRNIPDGVQCLSL